MLILVGLFTAAFRYLFGAFFPKEEKTDALHPIELLEHAPNNYELVQGVDKLLPLIEWINRLEDWAPLHWLLRAKDNALWYTPDAPVGWIFRVLNKVDAFCDHRLGVRLVNINRRAFLAKCDVLDKPKYKQCPDDDSANGFRLMLDACEADHMSAIGRIMMQQLMNGWIDTRVSLDNYVAKHPEVLDVEIRKPIIIIGCPRTASTFMHKLLAQDPRLRKPHFWELAIPTPPPDPATYHKDPRRNWVIDGFKSFDAISPHFYEDVRKLHYFGVDEIEEDSVVVHYAGVLAMHGIAFSHDSEYAKWQRQTTGKEAAYMLHKKVLQILSSKWPQPAQWLLKAPTIHSVYLEQLLKTYPDACLVVTHRRAVEVLPSWLKFVLSPVVATLWRHGSKIRLREQKTREQLELFERIERSIANARAVHGEERFFDVEYDDLMKDPLGEVRRCYAHFGLDLSAEAEGAMQTFLDGRGTGSQNKHFNRVRAQTRDWPVWGSPCTSQARPRPPSTPRAGLHRIPRRLSQDGRPQRGGGGVQTAHGRRPARSQRQGRPTSRGQRQGHQGPWRQHRHQRGAGGEERRHVRLWLPPRCHVGIRPSEGWVGQWRARARRPPRILSPSARSDVGTRLSRSWLQGRHPIVLELWLGRRGFDLFVRVGKHQPALDALADRALDCWTSDEPRSSHQSTKGWPGMLHVASADDFRQQSLGTPGGALHFA